MWKPNDSQQLTLENKHKKTKIIAFFRELSLEKNTFMFKLKKVLLCSMCLLNAA